MPNKLPTQTYHQIARDQVDFEFARNKLKLKSIETKNSFAEKFPQAHKFFQEKGIDLGKIREQSAKLIRAGTLAGSLFLNLPNMEIRSLPNPAEIISKLKEEKTSLPEIPQKILLNLLGEILPAPKQLLTRGQEKALEQIFAGVIGIKAKATLEGEHLNTTYGLIGAEQHLRRYPGDTLVNHGKGPEIAEGIAPGLGGWGYFAPSKQALTPSLENTEKWYAVVQTLYLPDWKTRLPYLINWYKYRKVLIVNTDNGNAVIAAIADSGPAAFTGKSFGGSPEVMEYLGGPRYKKGPVVVFFVDDPENKVPLGPVEYNDTSLSGLSLHNV